MINRNFTLLWLGKIVSQLGDKFYAIALAWWILQKTNSPSIMGFFLLASALPAILLGLFAGVFTDRLQRKTLLVVTDIIRGALVLIVALLSMLGTLEVWHVFAIGICLSLATAFFDPAVQAIIPEIVDEEQLTRANGMSQMVSGICSVAGPLLGAVAVAVIGMTPVFLANGISYIMSAILAFFIRSGRTVAPREPGGSLWKEMLEGIAFVRGQARIRFVLVIIAIAHFFMGCLTVTLPFLANSLAGSGVNNLGYLEMMLGAGLLAGSLVISMRKKKSVRESSLVYFIAAAGICFLAIALAQLLAFQSVVVYLVVMSAIGACIAGAFIFWQSLLQRNTPENMTGRVFGISTLISNVTLPVAYGIFGLLLSVSSIFVLMAASGACLLALCGYLFVQSRRQFETATDGISEKSRR